MSARTVACVHPSAELYGADRALLTWLSRVDRDRLRPVVLVPREGPLTWRLRALDVPVRVVPVGRVERSTLRARALSRLPLDVVRAQRALDRVLAREAPDVVLTNTLAALGGAVWARRRGVPHLWHVHEIVTRPALARRALAEAVRRLAQRVVCNSPATRSALVAACPALAARATVVPNGLDRPAPDPEEAARWRAALGLPPQALLVACVGRISRWKGQPLLVDAAERAQAALERGGAATRLALVVVGDAPPGQPEHLTRLRERVAASPLAAQVRVLPFQEDVWPVWDACDVAVVPSTEPEPFGLVALEAMLAGKPVIAAAHGGLAEVVRHEQTGLLIAPNDPAALAAALVDLASAPERREGLGAAGAARARAEYSADRYAARLTAEVEALLQGTSPTEAAS